MDQSRKTEPSQRCCKSSVEKTNRQWQPTPVIDQSRTTMVLMWMLQSNSQNRLLSKVWSTLFTSRAGFVKRQTALFQMLQTCAPKPRVLRIYASATRSICPCCFCICNNKNWQQFFWNTAVWTSFSDTIWHPKLSLQYTRASSTPNQKKSNFILQTTRIRFLWKARGLFAKFL